ncbi:MAG: glucose-6-phosphate isomerase [Planctomycetota bacterium]|nr:glucose-6-phosphate isomerase [Planctomycetota bacterium]
MGLLYERALLDGTGLDADAVRRLEQQAGKACAGLGQAPFSLHLDGPLPQASAAQRVVVLGVGGSALGARAVHEACAGPAALPLTVVDNIDARPLEAAWNGGDPARTAWVVVSKSGGTAETLAHCAWVRERLQGLSPAPEVHIVTGDSGPLRDLALDEGLPLHAIPAQVGGRFSVFTAAGVVPLALAGLDVQGLRDGARAALRHATALAAGSAPAAMAGLLAAAAASGRNVVVVWAYGERLEATAEWFRQLWGESLGKQRADGTRAGQTPVHCIGSTDQHSMQQLIIEGPRDKAVLVLAGPGQNDAAVPAAALEPLGGQSFDAILDAMRRGTTDAMVRAGCPAATLKLDAWSERSLGALLMTLLLSTVLTAHLWDVDPYGQPGVEEAKAAATQLLREPDGEAARRIARTLGEGDGIRVD